MGASGRGAWPREGGGVGPTLGAGIQGEQGQGTALMELFHCIGQLIRPNS